VSFGQILDRSGVAFQIYVRRDDIGDDDYSAFKRLDVGDIVGVSGDVMRTDTGQLSVQVDGPVRLLVKGLVPPPEKWHGLTDVEARYRQRHIDLSVNPDVRKVFEARAKIIAYIRRFLDDRGYIEVETPTLQPLYGGANARPFVTHHNTYDTDMYLRIATELYLKRLVAGGLERVYEIGKNFRNEGVDTQHNPEFTAIEFYEAYATFDDLMDLTETMIVGIADALHGESVVPYQGHDVDWSTPWRRLTARDAVLTSDEVSEADLADRDSLAALLKRHGHKAPDHMGAGGLLMEAFDAFAEHTLIQPTFVTHYPTEVSPLSRPSAGDPDVVDRFELFVCGREIANAFSELNDPDDQRRRFEAQDKAKALGDDEAHPVDEEFLSALEWGMPPTAGEGIGIDRLVMLMTDSASIRDVLLFPLLRTTTDESQP
jgi:lysyl-tRNA synthetase class 2